MKDKSKLLHDINSGLSSLGQALELIHDQPENVELIGQLIPLSREKISRLMQDWNELKQQIK